MFSEVCCRCLEKLHTIQNHDLDNVQHIIYCNTTQIHNAKNTTNPPTHTFISNTSALI